MRRATTLICALIMLDLSLEKINTPSVLYVRLSIISSCFVAVIATFCFQGFRNGLDRALLVVASMLVCCSGYVMFHKSSDLLYPSTRTAVSAVLVPLSAGIAEYEYRNNGSLPQSIDIIASQNLFGEARHLVHDIVDESSASAGRRTIGLRSDGDIRVIYYGNRFNNSSTSDFTVVVVYKISDPSRCNRLLRDHRIMELPDDSKSKKR